MAAPTRTTSQTKRKPQDVFNISFDEDFNLILVEPVGYDGVGMQRTNADNLALKITVVGNYTYIGTAKPGTAEATAKWKAMRLDKTSGIVITWADGNADFDNVATDLTALSYS